MRVLVVGSAAHDSTLARMCERAFESLGCEVTLFDKRVPTVPFLGWTINANKMRKRLIRRCDEYSPDLVFVIKGEQLCVDTIVGLKDTGAVICNWNPDNPFQARGTNRRMEQYLETLSEYDEVFIWSDELFEPLYDAGAESVHELPFGFDPRKHYPIDPDPELDIDVLFAGHWSKKRQKLLKTLVDLDIELAVYGNGWQKHCFDRKLRSRHQGSAVYGTEYSRLYCSSKICINIVADHNLQAYNMRSFEIPATGSFMLTSRTKKQNLIFGENDGIACFNNPSELRQKVRYYITENKERDTIAESGHETVQTHSYRDRMKTVIKTSLDNKSITL
jgi:spore maturation protein CgeB